MIFRKLFQPKSLKGILESYIKKEPRARFIQIGSNNGVNNDPLRPLILKYKISGILLEPVGYIFEQLVENYEGTSGLDFVNAAVSDIDGEKEFYRLRQSSTDLPIWYDQLGSFNLSVILKHKAEIPDIENYIICEKIKTITFKTLIKKYPIRQFDIIHIDTEGYDYEIIKLIPFQIINPKIVIFEHKHLSDEIYGECYQYLISKGFKLSRDGDDTVAVKRA